MLVLATPWKCVWLSLGKIGVKLTGPCGSDPGQSPSSREGRWSGYSNIWLGPRDVPKLDHALANFINKMFFDGQDPSDASTLLAATKFYRTDVDKMNILVKAKDAMKGFRKLEPPQGRPPLPWPMLCVIVRNVWDENAAVAMWLLTIWATRCRPGEALKLRRQDVVPPSKMSDNWIIILNSQKLQGQSMTVENNADGKPVPKVKVGESDEAVIVDQPYMAGFGEMLTTYLEDKEPHKIVFGFPLHQGTTLFNKVVSDLQYVSLGINCVRQLRHGSASTDVLSGLRTLTEVQKRGRWSVIKSVRRCSNGGRAAQVYTPASAPTKRRRPSAQKWIEKIFADAAGYKV